MWDPYSEFSEFSFKKETTNAEFITNSKIEVTTELTSILPTTTENFDLKPTMMAVKRLDILASNR